MKRMLLIALICALSLTIWSGPAFAANRCREVTTLLQEYERAYNAGDAQAVANLYTEDGLLLPQGTPVKGRAAISEYWKTHMGKGLKLVVTECELGRETGWGAGTWKIGESGGNFLIALRREKGHWRLAADTYNEPSKP